MAKIKIFVAHDHDVLRAGLLHLLSTVTAFSVVGQAGDAKSLLRKMEETPPDILLLGFALSPEEIGLLLEKIHRKTPVAQTLVLIDGFSELEQITLVRAGAKGLLHSNVPGSVLQKAVLSVFGGEYWVDRKTIGRLFGSLVGSPRQKSSAGKNRDKLSKREIEVLTLLGSGSTNNTIAERLFISEKTVKTHLKNIFSKLKINNRIQASMAALEMDLKP